MNQELSFTREYLNIMNGFQDNLKKILSIYNELLKRIPSPDIRNNTHTTTRRNVDQQNIHRTTNTRDNVTRDYIFTYLPRSNIGSQVLNTRIPFPTRNTNLFQYENLQPVVVRPTPTQLLRAVEYKTYNSNATNQESDPIDQNDFVEGEYIVQIRQCGHCFRPQNFDTWFQSNVRCPLCRLDIRELPNTNTENDDSSSNEAHINSTTTPNTNENTTNTNSHTASNVNEQQLMNNLINYANILIGDLEI